MSPRNNDTEAANRAPKRPAKKPSKPGREPGPHERIKLISDPVPARPPKNDRDA